MPMLLCRERPFLFPQFVPLPLCRLTIHELTGEGWLRSIGRSARCTPQALRPLTRRRFGLNAFALGVTERPTPVRFRLAQHRRNPVRVVRRTPLEPAFEAAEAPGARKM